jgi:hypothetical protein
MSYKISRPLASARALTFFKHALAQYAIEYDLKLIFCALIFAHIDLICAAN